MVLAGGLVSKGVKVIDDALLDDLTHQARQSPRLRQHYNLHTSYDDPCQRLLNAIEPDSYLRPKRDVTKPRIKLLVALRGKFAMLRFDDDGKVLSVHPFAAGMPNNAAAAVEVEPDCWTTTISLASGSVLLETRPGPFDAACLGDFAPWAPKPDTEAAISYLKDLHKIVRDTLSV